MSTAGSVGAELSVVAGVAPSTAPGDDDQSTGGVALALVELTPMKPKKVMTTRRGVDAYLRYKRASGAMSRTSAQGLGYILHAFAEVATDDPAKITRRDAVRWMKTTGDLSINTRRQYFLRARAFTAWLQAERILSRDPFSGIVGPRVPRSVHRALDADQAKAILAACVTTREKVIVILGLHAGLRRAELAGLEVGDVNLSAKTIFVRRGKGGHQRLLPLSTEACGAMHHYLATEGLRSGPLLRSLNDPQSGVRPATVGADFRRVAYRAGVKIRSWDRVGAHSMRHTAATAWYEDTSDVLAVRDLLGHVSLATTQVYVRGMNVERLRSAVEGRTYLDEEPQAEEDPSGV